MVCCCAVWVLTFSLNKNANAAVINCNSFNVAHYTYYDHLWNSFVVKTVQECL